MSVALNEAVLAKTVKLCRERGILIPTFAELRDPTRVPDKVKNYLYLAHMYFEWKRYDEALKVIGKGERLPPRRLHQNSGSSETGTGRSGRVSR